MNTKQVRNMFVTYGVVLVLLVASNLVLFAQAYPQLNPFQPADNIPATELGLSEFDEAVDAGIARYIARQEAESQQAQAQEQQAAQERARNVPGLQEDDHVRGDRDAPILLIEYSDLECPFCQRFHPTAEAVVEKYDGEVAWVYRHYPLSIHAGAQAKAEASECVASLGGNDAFWSFTAVLMEQLANLPVDQLRAEAEKVGVDGAAFQACLDSGEMTARVNSDMQEGIAAGVSGTPGNILLNTATGEVRLIPGAVGENVVDAAVAELQS